MPKPTLPEVIPLALDYYAKNGNSACNNLHIVLGDGNIKNHFVESCLQRAQEANDVDGIVLAKLLLRMSRTQRKKLYILNKKPAMPTEYDATNQLCKILDLIKEVILYVITRSH